VSDIVVPVEQRFLIQFTKCMIRKCQQVTVNIIPRFNFTVFYGSLKRDVRHLGIFYRYSLVEVLVILE